VDHRLFTKTRVIGTGGGKGVSSIGASQVTRSVRTTISVARFFANPPIGLEFMEGRGMPDWTAIATAAGAAATAVGAGFVFWQIWSASDALYGTNSYAVHKDLIDAYDHVLETEDQLIQKNGPDPALKAALKRQVIRLDTIIETAEGLRNNNGLSAASWKHILSSMCPNFETTNYKIGGFDMRAAQTACERGQTFWKAQPK
jgi:hypothetical protein